MGILNLTPDSFSDGGKYNSETTALKRVEVMLDEGATLIDIGGYSSRPGAIDISPAEEIDRIQGITEKILKEFPAAIISIDTFRSAVAKTMLDIGVHIINDISAGKMDANMMPTVAQYDAPYVMMHMQGTPQTMQQNPSYTQVVEEIMDYFVERINLAREAGIKDVLLDPGFGFGKTIEHNYEILHQIDRFQIFGMPVLVGISRKSMIYKPLGLKPTEILHLTSALHLDAMKKGAKILRVHDVKEAVETVKVFNLLP